MGLGRVNTHEGRTQEQWLKAEGITVPLKRQPKPRRQYKSCEGQMSLFEKDENGKPLAEKAPKRKRAKRRQK